MVKNVIFSRDGWVIIQLALCWTVKTAAGQNYGHSILDGQHSAIELGVWWVISISILF